ncbi:aspartate aminotransferase family protein, partial [Campylobacter jejuni]|nr:aspartate aminotransferase family protein [Campylobacter jejuni]
MKMDYKEQSHIIPTYKRFDIVLEKGQGVYLFDDKAKKYLDFSSGIGVCALGYN